MSVSESVLQAFHRVLVEEIASKRPEYLAGPFTVAEIYQDLVPYSTHRGRIGVDINGDYEDALIRMLAGEGGYLVLESEHALRDLRRELETRNPNTGVYREYAAVDVRLNPDRVDASPGSAGNGGGPANGTSPAASTDAGADTAPGHEAPGQATPAHEGSSASPERGGETATGAGPGAARRAESSTEGSGGGPDADSACRWCRAGLPDRDDLKYCPYCGTDVLAVPCPSCGQELEADWRFCIACGADATS